MLFPTRIVKATIPGPFTMSARPPCMTAAAATLRQEPGSA